MSFSLATFAFGWRGAFGLKAHFLEGRAGKASGGVLLAVLKDGHWCGRMCQLEMLENYYLLGWPVCHEVGKSCEQE
jgi:hypothetical protein